MVLLIALVSNTCFKYCSKEFNHFKNGCDDPLEISVDSLSIRSICHSFVAASRIQIADNGNFSRTWVLSNFLQKLGIFRHFAVFTRIFEKKFEKNI